MKLATGPATAISMRCQRGRELNSCGSPVVCDPGISPAIFT
jgi:hypothetical protein